MALVVADWLVVLANLFGFLIEFSNRNSIHQFIFLSNVKVYVDNVLHFLVVVNRDSLCIVNNVYFFKLKNNNVKTEKKNNEKKIILRSINITTNIIQNM